MATEAAQNVTAQVKEGADRALESSKRVLENVVTSAKDLQEKGGKPVLVLGLVGAMFIAFALAAALYMIVTRSISSSKTYVISETSRPVICTKLTRADGSGIPAMDNGKRFTTSFWVYINDLNVNHGMIRRVFSRGSTDTAENQFPFVAINDKLNKIHVCFATTDTSQYTLNSVAQNVSNWTMPDKVAFLSAVHGITIDYVPMQRWVHVAVVVNEESDSGVIMAYVDGELVKTVTTNTSMDDLKLSNGTIIENIKLEIKNFDMSTKGDVMIGGDMSTGVQGFSGLVSQIGFTNSDMNADDIYKMYLQGPISGPLAKMGLSSYGIQSPIYRIG